MRRVSVNCKTREVDVKISVNIDGSGKSKISTGIAFLDHLLTLLSYHSLIDINLDAKGDLLHHTAEDVALCLGRTIRKAVNENPGIIRFGSAAVPMDDSLASVAIDLGGRPYHVVDLKISKMGIEDMAGEDIYHFIRSLSDSLSANIHVKVEYGDNDHHKVEAVFKALALSLRQALTLDSRKRGVPSSKEVI